MEGVAWFTHKYVMHGFLWVLHKDHHDRSNHSPFEKNDFFEGDLLKDFCKECGIQLSSEFKYGFKNNQTLNILQMKCLRYLNEFFPRFKNKKLNPRRNDLVKFIYNNFKTSNYFKPTQKEYNLFSQEFAKEDEIIRNRFFPNKVKLWQSYKKGYEIKENSFARLRCLG